jgi:lipoprotein NlpI
MPITSLFGALALILVLLCGGLDSAYADAANDLKEAGQAARGGNPQGAVELYTRAIDSGELSDSQAYEARLGRGIAYALNKQTDQAIVDLSEAIRLDPDMRAYFARGNVYFSTGQCAEARDDYDALYRTSPRGFQSQNALYRNFRPILRLGTTKFCLGDYAGAAADFARALPRGQSRQVDEQYAAIWLYLARGRQGRDERASLAKQVPTTATKLDWPAPVVSYLLDSMPIDQLLAEAAGEPDATLRRRKYCEAYFYAGENALLRGDPQKAIELLKTAIAACDGYTEEYQVAKAELQRVR